MKKIGLIGGTSWYSTVDYYRYINEEVNRKLGGYEAAEMIIYSVNFSRIREHTFKNEWDIILDIVADAALNLQKAGADIIVIGANTMHHIYDELEKRITAPIIHIADATAAEVKKQNISTVGLLGTMYTMQYDFFKDRLARHGIQTLIPDEREIEVVNNCIYNELNKGIFLPETKETFIKVIEGLKEKGAGGVILGCTEIPLLIKQHDSPLPIFDTTLLHARAAVETSLS